MTPDTVLFEVTAFGLVGLIALALILVGLVAACMHDNARCGEFVRSLTYLDPALDEAFQGNYYGVPTGELDWDRVIHLAKVKREHSRTLTDRRELDVALATLAATRSKEDEE